MDKKPQTECPITKVAQLLSDTWTMLIMHNLMDGSKRFCELERTLHPISTRTLTLKLQKLIELELAFKNEDGSYVASKKGMGLSLIEDAMRAYEKKYL